MPATIKLKEEFGDDLAIVLVESQGADEERFMKFAAARKWLGRDLMWTRERPFSTGAGGLPNFALLDEEGRVVLMGNPLSLHGQIEDEITAAIARARKGPKDLPKSAAKVRGMVAKGDWAKALKQLDRELPKVDGEEAQALQAEAAELERRLDAELARLRWLLENGYADRAQEQAEALVKGCKGSDALLARTEPLAQEIEGAEAELAAAKALAKLEAALYEDGPDAKLAKRLAKVAEDHAGTRVAARAAVLAGWADQ